MAFSLSVVCRLGKSRLISGVYPEQFELRSSLFDGLKTRQKPSSTKYRYLDVQIVEPGDERGLGKVVSLYTKGWLPYTLRWSFRVTDVRQDGFTLEAWGDFDGRGIWTFEQDGHWVNITYDWKIRAEKPMLRYFSFLVKPIFAANHRWAMAKGEESLRLELARRHAATAEQRALIPAPPQPTTSSIFPILLGTTAVVGALGGLFYLFQRSLAKE